MIRMVQQVLYLLFITKKILKKLLKKNTYIAICIHLFCDVKTRFPFMNAEAFGMLK